MSAGNPILSLELEGFQSHQDTRLVLSPGLNALTGVTDAGKSSALRAIEWVTTNRPQGDAFVSRQTPAMCRVTITTARGVVVRERSKKFNGYRITIGKKTVDLKDIKGSVPPQVAEVIDLRGINMQGQFDKIFLLADSPGEVSRYLADVLGFDRTDKAVSAAKAALTLVNGHVSSIEARQSEARATLARLDFVDDVNEDLKDAERMQGEIDAAVESADALRQAADVVAARYAVVKRARARIEILELDTVTTDLALLEQSVSSRRELLRALDLVDASNRIVRGADALLEVLDAAPELTESLAELDELANTRSQLHDAANALDTCAARVATARDELSAAAFKVSAAREAYVDALLRLGACPTCGGTVQAKTAAQVAAEL